MRKKLWICGLVLISTFFFSGCRANLAEDMARAGMNTLMGMGTVFLILIFIAFLISRFKYISRFEAWLADRSAKKSEKAVDSAENPVESETNRSVMDVYEEQEENMADDLALVAVITAALAASLETSPDKLVVRSIRRKNTNRW